MKPVESLHHVGIAVHSIAAQRPFYEHTLGAHFEGVEEVPDQKVRIAFFRVGPVRLELLEPTAPDGPVARFLDRRGEGLHHLAFAVQDLESRIAELKSDGVQMIDEIPRPGAGQMQIAFAHPASTGGVLVELCEPPTSAKASPGASQQ